MIPVIALLFYSASHCKANNVSDCYNAQFAKNLKNFNFQLLGKYDTFVYHSLRIWCYYLEVQFYRKGITEDVYQLLLDWNKTCNVDPGGILNDAIERSHTLFLDTVDVARREKIEPEFGVPVDFDVTNYGNSLKCNDYVDMNTIINYVNDIMVVHNGQ